MADLLGMPDTDDFRERAVLEVLPAVLRSTVPVDELCALWVDQAPRFGAVATHFPESLRKRRFVASFWAPEVFFPSPDGREGWYRDLPESPRTRAMLDSRAALIIRQPCAVGRRELRYPAQSAPEFQYVDRGRQRFWSPELPEVLPFDGEGNARAAAGCWRDVCVYTDPVGHRRIAHRLLRGVAHV